MDETIIKQSNLGKRLDKIPKNQAMYIKYHGKDIPVVSKITIGRSRANNICLDDDNLASRDHAMIQKIKDSYFITDLNSTNGTMVNDKVIPKGKYIRIHTKDVIRVGRTELTIKSFLE